MVDAASIARKLIPVTIERRIKWEPLGTEAFTADFGNIKLSISGPSIFIFTIYDQDGNRLDSFSDTDPASAVGQLFDAARRRSLDVDEKLEELDRKLDKLR